MTNAFLLVTTGDRADRAYATITSVITRYTNTWALRVLYQDYTTTNADRIQHLARTAGVDYADARVPNLLGPFIARRQALLRWGDDADVWCNLDDDMRLLPDTNYAPVVAKLAEAGVGIVACNWLRSLSPALRQRARYEDRFERKAIVYTGGGYCYGPPVVDLIRRAPPEPWLFDNVQWSLLSYLAGRDNYRYLGSLALHAIVGPGGRRRWTESGTVATRKPPDPRYVRVEPSPGGKGGDVWLMPASDALTSEARAQHRAARAEAGWT